MESKDGEETPESKRWQEHGTHAKENTGQMEPDQEKVPWAATSTVIEEGTLKILSISLFLFYVMENFTLYYCTLLLSNLFLIL